MKNLYLIISIFLSLASSPIIAKESFVGNEIMLWDHANVIEDKFYLQPDNIYFSPNQIYVKLEEDLIPIEHLSCDRNGVFTSIKEIETGRAMQATWKCPQCEFDNYDGIDNCGLCGRYRYAKDQYYQTDNR